MPAPARPPRRAATALLTALVTGLSALLVLAAPPASADAPGNDDLVDATPIELAAGVSSDVALTTAEATKETGEPTPCGLITNTVWVAYTALDDQILTATTTATTTQMDTVLAAHTAATPGTYPLTDVGCNDDSGGIGRLSRLSFFATGGTTYYFQVGHWGGTPQPGDPGPGPLELELTTTPALPNDSASTPTEITGATGTTTVDTTQATHATTDPDRPTPTGHTLWYSWTADFTGTEVFTAAGASDDSPDTFLYAFPATGDTTMATALEYNDDVDEDNEVYRSRIVVDVVINTTYRILAGTRSDHGEFTLSWDQGGGIPGPANDDLAQASAIVGSSGTSAGSLANATSEPQDPNLTGTSGGHSVWWRWTAPAAGLYEFTTSSADEPPDTVLAVFTGSGFDTLDEVAFNDDAEPDSAVSRVLLRATADTVYTILVDGWPSRFRGPFVLSWNAFVPTATTTTLSATSPTPGVVDLASTVVDADGQPGNGGVTILDAGDEVGTFPLAAGGLTQRIRLQAGGGHSYVARFDPATDEQATSSSPPQAVTVVARPRPANDDFADATVISGGSGTVIGIDLLGAGREPGDALAPGVDGATVWYRWTAPVSDAFTFTVASADPDVDSVLGAFRGSTFEDLTLLRMSQDPAGPGSEITFSAIEGRTYYLLLDAFVPGTVSLAWSRAGGTSTTTTLTATAPGFYAVHLEAQVTGATAGTVVFLRDGSVLGQVDTGTGSAVLDRTGQEPGASTFTAEFYPDDTTVRPSESAAVPLTVTAAPPPSNDLFTNAVVITGTPQVGTTVGGTADPGTPPSALPGNADATVWYRWVAPATGTYEFAAARTTSGDPVLRVFEGTTLATLRTVAENDDESFGSTRSLVGINAVRGHTYHLAVDAFNRSATGPFQLTWEAADPTQQATATALTAGASGRTVTLRATVDDPASTAHPGAGYVEFFEGTASRGVVRVTTASALAVRTLTNVIPGTRTYRAVFVPNDYLVAPSTSPNRAVAVKKTATRTSLVAPARARAGTRPNVTATVKQGTVNATGRVRFTVNGRTVGTVALRNGRAVLRLRPVTIGLQRVTATYLGTAVLAPSSATRSMTVTR